MPFSSRSRKEAAKREAARKLEREREVDSPGLLLSAYKQCRQQHSGLLGSEFDNGGNWDRYQDPMSGAFYLYNPSTGGSVWEGKDDTEAAAVTYPRTNGHEALMRGGASAATLRRRGGVGLEFEPLPGEGEGSFCERLAGFALLVLDDLRCGVDGALGLLPVAASGAGGLSAAGTVASFCVR